MNTDTGRIYTSEEMEFAKEFRKSLEGVPEQSDFKLSDFVAKNKSDPRKMAEEILKADQEYKLMKMKLPPTKKQLAAGKVGRNDPCGCGSGVKFKKCHWTGHKI